MTKYVWTVYQDGELFDIMTDAEVAELMRTFKTVMVDLVAKVVRF